MRRFRGLTALDDVSLTVRTGEILGIVGPNGSGKTTLFNVISGFYRPNGGTVRLSGRVISGARPNQVSRLGVARTFQHLRLFGNLTVADNMLVWMDRTRTSWCWRYLCWPAGIWRYDRQLKRRAGELLAGFGLAQFAGASPGALPYGIQRRLELARAIASSPRLLLLDEPSMGLSPKLVEVIGETLRRLRDDGLSLLLVEQNAMLTFETTTDCLVLEDGEVALSGTAAELSRNARVRSVYIGL